MKILQLVTRRQFRGAEVFAANLSSELLNRNVEIIFAGLYAAPETPLTVGGAFNHDFNGKKSFLSLSLLWRVRKFILKHQPDIIQANGSDTLKYAALISLLSGGRIPVVYRNISMVSAWVGKNVVKKMFYRWLFRNVRFVTSVGNESIHDLVQTMQFPEERTLVIRRGIPLAPVDKRMSREFLTAMFNIPSETLIAVHVGNFSPEKNHLFLIEVFSAIRSSRDDIRLVLVGDGDLKKNITREIHSRALHDTIFLAGFQSNVSMFLSGADVFVLCSLIEGIPGVIMEAAVQQTPSVAIEVGGVKEVVRDGETGVLVQGYDPLAFAAKLIAILDDAPTRRHLALNAFELAKKEFNPEINTAIFVELYKKVVAEK